jgi:integrase
MAIRLPSHLHRARSGILHFRIAIPPDLQQHFKTREIYRSLRTANVREATPAAQTLSQAAKRAFQQIRTQTMSNQKKSPQDPFDGSDWSLQWKVDIPGIGAVTIQSEEHDRPGEFDEAIASTIKHAAGLAGAGSQAFPQAAKKSSSLFSELIEDYKRDRLAAKRCTPKTQDENLAVYKLCIDIIGDLPISEIGEDEALTYFETMQKLPPNMNKMPAYKGKTIAEIIALKPTPMATRTINKSLERISSLFKFATLKPKYDLRYNPFSGRSLDESDGQQREPFTNDELARLFGAAEHAQRQYTTAYSYWLPLMGLLTGARLNELCQLHLSDFEVVGGIDCINIKDAEEGQRLKNKSAKRLVPIHDKLIEVGLIRYVDRLRAQGHDRLYPTLRLTDEGYGKMPSRWFGRFKERCVVSDNYLGR